MSASIPNAKASPFSLEDDSAYAGWRAARLAAHQGAAPVVALGDIAAPDPAEISEVLRHCQERNYAVLRCQEPPADPAPALLAFTRAIGLESLDRNLCSAEDGLTPITVRDTGTDNSYIPYTDRPLGWHTDGYYNPPDFQVRAWLLYCAQPASEGGDNELLDHEVAYIRLRDENPEWIRALMAPDALTIPANTESGGGTRPAQGGPVFSVSQHDGTLHMRYSARQRNVVWKDDPVTRAAAEALLALFRGADPLVVRHRLQRGEGILSNNVLHRRDGFRDNPAGGHKRLLFRARYYRRLPEPPAPA
jgi:alpha-ketoglutarate-dependent taurine dioxygenase